MTIRSERGFALIELIIAASLMIVVVTATLFSYDQFTSTTNANQTKNDAQDSVRFAMDRLAVDIRNGSSPTSAQPVQRSGAYDLIIGSVNPTGPNDGQNAQNYDWVRYCIDNTNPTNEVLWKEVVTWTGSSPAQIPSTTSCPGSGWPSQTVAANHITNESGGQNRPAFYYNSTAPPGITSIHAELYVDANPGHPPGETALTSGAFLRNAVPPPVALFTATPGGAGAVVLDGSASYDPAGRSLTYQWAEDGNTLSQCTAATCNLTAQSSGPHTFGLTVVNSANLQGVAQPQVVNVQ